MKLTRRQGSVPAFFSQRLAVLGSAAGLVLYALSDTDRVLLHLAR